MEAIGQDLLIFFLCAFLIVVIILMICLCWHAMKKRPKKNPVTMETESSQPMPFYIVAVEEAKTAC